MLVISIFVTTHLCHNFLPVYVQDFELYILRQRVSDTIHHTQYDQVIKNSNKIDKYKTRRGNPELLQT